METKVKNPTIKVKGMDILINEVKSPALRKVLSEVKNSDSDIDSLKSTIGSWRDKQWKQWRDGSAQRGCVTGCLMG